MFRIRVEDGFDASHVLPKHPGKCRNLHGHSYRVEIFLVGDELDENGFLAGVDFIELKRNLGDVVTRYDHRHLNDIMGENTTAENLAKRIFSELKEIGMNQLEKVRVWESLKDYAEYWE